MTQTPDTTPSPAGSNVAPMRPDAIGPSPLSAEEVAAYQALRADAVCFPIPVHWSVADGPQVIAALNGLITNDVTTLADGTGLYAAALTAKGKVLCDLAVLRVSAAQCLLLMSPDAATPWFAMTRKYINPRLARLTDDSASWRSWVIAGPQAPQRVSGLLDGSPSGAALGEWSAWRHAERTVDGATVRVARTAWLGSCPCFVVSVPVAASAGMVARVEALGVASGSPAVWEVARVEAGRPSLGVEMHEETLAQEVLLDQLGAISFTKGCYTGQETVARVHFRGHVNRLLRGVRLATPVVAGTVLHDDTGKVVGDLRRVVISPSFGPIGLAMVRREIEAGQPLSAGGSEAGAAVMAELITLPFVG